MVLLTSLILSELRLRTADHSYLRHEWRVVEKRLYEIGIPGRYNKCGEWKPLIYPGSIEPLEKDARSLSQEDDVHRLPWYRICCSHKH